MTENHPPAVNPLISVIIPARDAERFLPRSLAGLFRSTFPAWECIVVDDGSRDNTASLCRDYNTRVISNPVSEGPAAARNRASLQATGKLLVFLDADIAVRPDTLQLLWDTFDQHPDISAAFGSYDDTPADSSTVSAYKNLFHHYVHQRGAEEASTFWCGCGAVRRDVFMQLRGFNEGYLVPAIEDIEFGYRLRFAGHRISLRKAIQVTHLKPWTLGGLLRTDLFQRAIPWTVLMLDRSFFPNDLNFSTRHKVGALVAVAFALCLPLAALNIWFVGAAVACVGLFPILNWDFYSFLIRRRGYLFALTSLPLHLLYSFYSVFGFGLGVCRFLWKRGDRRTDSFKSSIPPDFGSNVNPK